jgi:hypothetical protein
MHACVIIKIITAAAQQMEIDMKDIFKAGQDSVSSSVRSVSPG